MRNVMMKLVEIGTLSAILKCFEKHVKYIGGAVSLDVIKERVLFGIALIRHIYHCLIKSQKALLETFGDLPLSTFE